MISAGLGTKLPSPGTIYIGQDLRFRHPVSIRDTITATVAVREKKQEKSDVTLDCVCTNQQGEPIITGTAYTRAPAFKVRRPRIALPHVQVDRHDGMHTLMARAHGGSPVSIAVVYPSDAASLMAALDAAKAGLIAPVLIGPLASLEGVARAQSVDLAAFRLIDAPDGPSAAAQAVVLARADEARC